MAKPHVLTIDDEPRIVEMLAEVLKGEGYRVSTATSGEQGLRIYDEDKPDLVLLDVMMPGMNGFEVLKALREKGDVPVIMLTGHADLTDVLEDQMDEVPDSYISKPTSREQLLTTIKFFMPR